MDSFNLLTLPSTIGVAFMVLGGMYGNGEERVERLEADGYDYDTVQDCVNDLCELIEKYGD
jgi:hypothetical protein